VQHQEFKMIFNFSLIMRLFNAIKPL